MLQERSGTARCQAWALGLAVLAAYATALPASYQFDDFNVIVQAPAVHGFGAWARDSLHGIRPLLKLSYLLNWTSGLGAVGFHAANAAIHAVNVLLFHRLARRMLGTGPAAFWAALAFALHPVQTEAVTYLSGRSVSLMALFSLLAILLHDRDRERGNRGWPVGSLLCFLAALLTRETALALPAILLLWDWQRGDAPASALRALRPHAALAAGILLTLPFHPGYRAFFSHSLLQRTLLENLRQQAVAIPYLLSRILLPWRLNLDPDLSGPAASPALAAAGLIALAAVTLLALPALRRRQLWGFAWFWLLLSLAPTQSLFPRRDLANERHLYLAVAGLALLAGQGLARLAAGPWRRAAAWALAALLALLTARRGLDYRTETALWEDTVRKSPLKPRAHNNLGYAYELEGRIGEARREYLRALAFDPDYRIARINLRAITGPGPGRGLPP